MSKFLSFASNVLSKSLKQTSFNNKSTLFNRNIKSSIQFRNISTYEEKYHNLVEEVKSQLTKNEKGNFFLKNQDSILNKESTEDYLETEKADDLLEGIRTGKIKIDKLKELYQKTYGDDKFELDIAARRHVLFERTDDFLQEDNEEYAEETEETEEEYAEETEENLANNENGDYYEGLSEFEEDDEVEQKDADDNNSDSSSVAFFEEESKNIQNYEADKTLLRQVIAKGEEIVRSGQVKAVQEDDTEDQEVDPSVDLAEKERAKTKWLEVQGEFMEGVNVDGFLQQYKDMNKNLQLASSKVDLSKSQEEQIAAFESIYGSLKGTNEEKERLKSSFLEQIKQFHKDKESLTSEYERNVKDVKDNTYFTNVKYETYN